MALLQSEPTCSLLSSIHHGIPSKAPSKDGKPLTFAHLALKGSLLQTTAASYEAFPVFEIGSREHGMLGV